MLGRDDDPARRYLVEYLRSRAPEIRTYRLEPEARADHALEDTVGANQRRADEGKEKASPFDPERSARVLNRRLTLAMEHEIRPGE
ncbi:hypothetical protein [Methylocystis sp.]|uniref:hypothetical protein n=1 Tax=Methylocystis sp. TaxID=1911079 RepID=UPI0025D0EAC1|nr:hypothetical protein [Methylocystis sp.]